MSKSASQLIDALANCHQVESDGIGPANAPSDVHGIYRALIGVATDDELIAAASHPSPVVRSYIGKWLASFRTDAVDTILSLLADDTLVSTQMGCIGNRIPVGEYVMFQLALAGKEGCDVLRQAAQSEQLTEEQRRLATNFGRLHSDE